MRKSPLRLAAGMVLALLLGVKATTFEVDCTETATKVETPAALAVGDDFAVKLVGGAEFLLKIVAAPPAGIAGLSYIARDTKSQASAVVKPTKGGLRVTIDDFEHNKIYSVRVRNGVAEASVHDTSGGESDVCGTCGGDLAAPSATTRTSRLKAATLGAANAFPIAEQRAVVDVLVAFDQGAVSRSAALGYETITNFADYAVSKMNTVLEKSQLADKLSYRLVGVIKVDATYDVINDNLLNALRLRNAGALAPVGVAREKCGADTITLLIDRDRDKSETSGLGYEYLSNSWSYATFDATGYTCNICDIKTVYDRYTMSHEQGHNMGCGHSNRQGDKSGPGCNPYSCGYHFVDAAGTKRYTIMAYDNTSPASGTYYPVPYFSSPEIMPEELGVPVGTPTNNNRLTILNNYKGVAAWREHVMPYEWDVRFLDGDGNEIADGSFFSGTLYITLTNANPEASIYYTKDGSTPNADSWQYVNGSPLPILDTTTITACAVTNGVAISFRKITVNEGVVWSGEAGQRGNGRWISDSSVLAWDDSTKPFNYGSYPSVCFADLAGISSATVTVAGAVAPYSASFTATDTSYVFAKGGDDSLVSLGDASFAPSGSLAFDVPVRLAATSFKTPSQCTVAFNAPFGQTVDASNGNCTNKIVVGDSGTIVVAPGAGKTQTFGSFNNTGNYYNTATLQIGEGTVVFNGPANGAKGLFGSTKIAVGECGNLVFNIGGATGSGVSSTLTVSKGGTVTFNQMEHMNRRLILDGGTVRCKRLDWMYGTTISVTDDSSIVENGSDGYVWIRFADATVDVAEGATLTLDVPITTGYDTANYGFVKTGGGELLANRPMSHTGATVVNSGTVTVGHSSSTRVGLGWSVKNGATLKLKEGCSLAVPNLALEGGATLALPAAASAPLSATNEVSLAGVRLLLDGAGDLTEGKSYPLLSSTGGLTGVSDAVVDALPVLSYGLEWEVYESGGTLSARVVAAQLPTTLEIAKGEVVRLADVPAHIEKIVGEGTLVCSGALPNAGYGFTSEEWRGIVSFKDLSNETFTRDFQCELYGNANSKVMFSGCRIQFLKGNGATFAGTLVLDGDAAFSTANGYSNSYNVFGALEGSGSMSFTGAPQQAYVFEVATNFTGSIDVGSGADAGAGNAIRGRRIVFGAISSSADLPPRETKSASITIRPGALASIGPCATWHAYHGVEIAGTLLVKGAGGVLDCNAGGTMGVSLLDGAKLRFDAADASLVLNGHMASGSSGSVTVEFASGVTPTSGQKLVEWSASGTVPAHRFMLSGGLASGWALAKEQNALRIYKMPDLGEDVFSMPNSGVRFKPDMDIVSWMGGYFDDIDLQEFLEEDGWNGLPRYLSYALGIDADYDTTVKTEIAIVDGKVVITPSKDAPEIPGVVLVTTLYGADELSGNLPPVNVFRGRSFSIDPFDGSAKGFYKLEVTIDAQ